MSTIIDKYFQLFKDYDHLSDQQITDITNMYNNLQQYSNDILTNYNTILSDKAFTYKNQVDSNIFFPKLYTFTKQVFLSDNKDKVLKCITCSNEHKDVFTLNFVKEIYCSNSFRNNINEITINHDIIVPQILDFGFINYDNTVLLFFISPFYKRSRKFNFYYDSINKNIKVNNIVVSKNDFYNLIPPFYEVLKKFIYNLTLIKDQVYNNIKLTHNDININMVNFVDTKLESISEFLNDNDELDDDDDSLYNYLMTNFTAISYSFSGNMYLHYNDNNDVKFVLIDFENTCWTNHIDEDIPNYSDFLQTINCIITDNISRHIKVRNIVD